MLYFESVFAISTDCMAYWSFGRKYQLFVKENSKNKRVTTIVESVQYTLRVVACVHRLDKKKMENAILNSQKMRPE
jgi:hypothetical protein